MHSKKLHLFLNGNPILCNCDSLHFIEWIFSTTVLFDREGNYPCPINPIPSDAFFITKRSTFLNVLKKLLSIDEHLEREKFSTLTLCSPYHL
jgi:hypothetical protein